MTLEVSETELDLLVRLLDHEISDLGPEIRRTQTTSYRDDLKAVKVTAVRLCGRLRETAAAAA